MLNAQHRTKRGRSTRQAATGGWQIVYTGFVLILLCFFIMLTSFASFQESKITQFVRSFSDAVTVFSDGNAIEEGQSMISDDADMVPKDDPLARLFEQVNLLGRVNGLDQIAVRRTPKGVVMTLTEKMLFSSGSATLSASSHPLLRKIASIIESVGVPVEIEGHTDNVPIETTQFPSNWELSTARAVNVLRFLTERNQVDHRRVWAVGMSQYHPVAPNTSADNRTRNRRVEIIFKAQ